MAAGCSHYEVFITGRKAIYFGGDGARHIGEIFRTEVEKISRTL